MKKLMIAVAIACAAAISQASQIKWSLDSVTEQGEAESPEGYLAYFFIASDTSGSTAASKLITLAAAEAYAKAGNVDALANAATASASVGAGGSATSGLTAQNASWIKNVAVESFAIILNNSDAKKATYYNIGLNTDDTEPALAYNKFSGSTNKSTAYVSEAGDWTAMSVPEPFSGALALLGMGAIALRRKMKKAKKA